MFHGFTRQSRPKVCNDGDTRVTKAGLSREYSLGQPCHSHDVAAQFCEHPYLGGTLESASFGAHIGRPAEDRHRHTVPGSNKRASKLRTVWPGEIRVHNASAAFCAVVP